MMTAERMETLDSNDAALVAGSLAGDREAFAQIVARYQSLICSLAYSATGSLAQSEDVAQETFVAAWKQLSGLREPGKLRSWLCGIARNLSYTAVHREGREPSHAAEPLQALDQASTGEPLPSERAITREEEAILWRSVARIPEVYREPFVLYYREHQSVEQVADWLDLSEDAVRQRLSRGRKLLQEQVTAFVESALERTSPGKAFTMGILAALPALSFSSQAAAVGVAAAKGSVIAKIPVLGVLSAIVVPVVGVLAGVLSVKTSLETAQSTRQRRLVIKTIWLMGAISFLALVGLMIPIAASESLWRSHGALLNVMIAAVGVGLPLAIVVTVLVLGLRHRRIRREEAGQRPATCGIPQRVAASGPAAYRHSVRDQGWGEAASSDGLDCHRGCRSWHSGGYWRGVGRDHQRWRRGAGWLYPGRPGAGSDRLRRRGRRLLGHGRAGAGVCGVWLVRCCVAGRPGSRCLRSRVCGRRRRLCPARQRRGGAGVHREHELLFPR